MDSLLKQKNFGILALITCLGAFVTGCQTYSHENHGLDAWRQNNVPAAIQEYTHKAEKERHGYDAVVWRLEQGAALRAAGQYKQSNDAFDLAEEKIDAYEKTARVKVGHEAAAILSNQAQLPYEGRPYDKIMLNTYKALNDLQLNDPDNARVELTRAYQHQQDAVAENAKKIEKNKEQSAKAKQQDREMARQAENDPGVKSKISDQYHDLDNIKGYADYVNPFTVYLDGLFFLCHPTDPSDLERAKKSFERVASLDENNKFIQQDIQTVADVVAGKPIPPTTYVIFETGLAPVREQVRIDLPVFVVGVRSVPYVGAAFPVLQIQPDGVPYLTVYGSGAGENTLPVASMDSIIVQDFRNELPSIITKTIISTIAKAGAAYGISEGVRTQGDIFGFISMIGTTLYQAAVNIADTRTWTTLPKQFQICRIPTPANRRLDFAGAGGWPKSAVTVSDGVVNVVYVKSITPSGPLQVSQFKLK